MDRCHLSLVPDYLKELINHKGAMNTTDLMSFPSEDDFVADEQNLGKSLVYCLENTAKAIQPLFHPLNDEESTLGASELRK